MKRFVQSRWLVLALALAVTACAPQTRSMSSQWDGIVGGNVAKVNNIQSLITPGFN